MKNIFNKLMHNSAAISGLTLLALCGTGDLQAQLDPSVLGPTWDFTISGNARGIARITFNSNFTLDGQLQIETRKKVGGNNGSTDERGGINSEDRTNGGTTNSAGSSVTNFFGSAVIDGQWGFDPATQRIIGFLNENSFVPTATTTNFVVNTLTFRGVLKGGANPRFTLNGTGALGRQTFQGVPLQALPDISGAFAATGKRDGQQVVEFFSLVSQGLNIYTVTNGATPGFTFNGQAILSARKQLSMVTGSEGTNALIVTSLVGSFKTNKLTGTLKGRDSRGPVSLKVFGQ